MEELNLSYNIIFDHSFISSVNEKTGDFNTEELIEALMNQTIDTFLRLLDDTEEERTFADKFLYIENAALDMKKIYTLYTNVEESFLDETISYHPTVDLGLAFIEAELKVVFRSVGEEDITYISVLYAIACTAGEFLEEEDFDRFLSITLINTYHYLGLLNDNQ